MHLTKTINAENLRNAMREIVVTEDIFNKVSAKNGAEMKMLYDRGVDTRDLTDLASLLRYKPVFDDPKNGKPLTDAEFETESEKLITAFVNDDREKIFEYLDEWFRFAAEYDPPENIQTEAEALKHIVYLRSQQGLTVTKMKNYPDYYKSRFRDMDSMMKLQDVQQGLFMQCGLNEGLFGDCDIEISTSSMRKYDEEGEERIKAFREFRKDMESIRRDTEKKVPMSNAFAEAFDLKNPAQKGQVSVRELVLADWVKELKNTDPATFTEEQLGLLTDTIRMSIGSTETGYGIVNKYLNTSSFDVDSYKTIFIDGINVYDSIPSPKKSSDAARLVLDALCNQTGVVSIAHVAEINGKFEYRIDALDVRDGENDKADYVEKIKVLQKSEQYRKALYAAEADNIDSALIPAKKAYEKKAREGVTALARTMESRKPYNDGKSDYTFDETNVAEAYGIIEKARANYKEVSKFLLSANYKDARGQEHPNPISEALQANNIDTRDFQDMIMLTVFARTLGVGDKDLTPDETKKETLKMITAFSKQNREEMKPYLDKMYNFLENYNPPKAVETTEDVMKAVLYMRVQQATEMKHLENPWYFEERYRTMADKADLSAFNSDYLITHEELRAAAKRDTGIEIAGSATYDVLIEKRARLAAVGREGEGNVFYGEPEMKENQFLVMMKDYASERRRRLAYTDEFEKCYTFKLFLPQSALVLGGDNPDLEEFADVASIFWSNCSNFIYNPTFSDSEVLRSYGFKNRSGDDSVRLIFIDGKSLYDIVEEENGTFSQKKAAEKLFDAAVNQKGLVQFARVLQGDGEIKMELDTLDFSGKTYVSEEYKQKLADFALNPTERFEAIKKNINSVCRERLYEKEQEEQWKGLNKGGEDLFEASEYDKRKEAEAKARAERIEQYEKEQQEQLNALLNADLDLYEDYNPVRDDVKRADTIKINEIENGMRSDDSVSSEREEQPQPRGIERFNFETFKDGRYVVPKRSPVSAYSVATMGELSELGVYFGGITSNSTEANYIEVERDEADMALEYNNNEPKDDVFDKFAETTGVGIDKRALDSVIGKFMLQNSDEGQGRVDKNVFAKQYKLLFGDLYMFALNALNKECCKQGKTITAEQTDETLRLLDKMMRTSAKEVGYPEKIVNGGFTPEQIKAEQEWFANNCVPQNSVEQQTRRMQAEEQGYDFADAQWKQNRMGYTAFGRIIESEKAKIDGIAANTPEDKARTAQTYRAMLAHSQGRGFWSKVFNFIRYSREKSAIEGFKTRALTAYGMGEREFNDLCAVRENSGVTALKNGIEANYRNATEKRNRADSMSESESENNICGASETSSERDKSDLTSSFASDNETRIKITVEEANHKRKEESEKKKSEDIKAASKERENNLEP